MITSQSSGISLGALMGLEGGAANQGITSITADSRQVAPGTLFAAIPGFTVDGRDYIEKAVTRGAVALLTLDQPDERVSNAKVPVIRSADPRRTLAELAARFYGAPPETLVAVTGTNGKTSVVDFVRQIWWQMGLNTASVGTLGVIENDARPDNLGAVNTTADPLTLHSTLADLAKSGTSHLAMEASSHGLHQRRLDGCRFKVAAFTNLTRDHLDYHKTEAAYLAAKGRLFSDLLAPGGSAIIFGTGPKADFVRGLAVGAGAETISISMEFDADWRISRLHTHPRGQSVTLEIDGQAHDVSLPLIGEFQLFNWLVAAATVVAAGADLVRVLATSRDMIGVPGRMEHIGEMPTGGVVLVDYAHTPSGLETVLKAAKPFASRDLVVLFGCGGDRDKGKRAQMGEIAARYADRIFVTDDNPRTENAAKIRAEVRAACPGAIEIGDRGDAIKAAIRDLKRGDVLIIAGKGHEEGQHVGGEILPFHDAAEAQKTISALGGVVGLPQRLDPNDRGVM